VSSSVDPYHSIADSFTVMDADVNEALMLLMRYPCPSDPNGPQTFVHDAIFLKANTDVDAGISVVTKYSGHAPPRIILERPMTPEQLSQSDTPDSRRARSPFDSPAAAANTVETVLHDAARGFLNRGERWGLNQALRDAVGEVRKNVQGLNSGRGSPRTGSLSGIRPLHRTTRSDVSTNIAANVLRKITALEERNKQLAKMLEGAVGELWKFEKDASEKKEVEGDSLQALSMAVAKVQFVQVFLQDATLPLPPEETENVASDPPNDETSAESTEEKALSPKVEPAPEPPQPQPSPMMKPTDDFTAAPTRSPSIPIPRILRPSSTQPPHQGLPTTLLSPEHASAPTAAGLSTTSSASLSTSLSSRPRLEQSSFSWMLGQAHEDRSGFVTASPFSPHEKRWNAAHGGSEKGFLFGEEDEVVGEVKVNEDKGKGKKGAAKGRSGSLLAREDIGLGDMGSGSEA
jgi:TBC1 domain family protein 5